MATLSVGGTTVFDGATLQSGAVLTSATFPGEINSSGGGGHVLQVVSTTITDQLSYTSQNIYYDIAGLTATITPSFTSSKILIMCDVAIANANSNGYVALLRGSSFVGVGPSSGSRSRVSSSNFYNSGTNQLDGATFQYLDSPSTTSATTYKVQSITDSSQATYVNRTPGDVDAVYGVRSQSTITLMEVKG
jgi:hypothetical protein